MTKDDILSMALEYGWKSYDGPINAVYSFDEKDIERFAALVAEKEREECAKVCEELVNEENSNDYRNAADWCATRIRARGQ